MPFTLAHPAAVLLLRRTGLPFAALVVGSMSPDFEYVLRLSPTSTVSHTPLGVFSFCLPAGLCVLGLWYGAWRPALRASWPSAAASVSSAPGDDTRRGPQAAALAVCASALAIVIGAGTHLAWDACTHAQGWFVERMPSLAATVVSTRWGVLRVFKVLQHGSTLAGLGLLAWAFHRGNARLRFPLPAARRGLAVGASLALVVGLALGLARAWGRGGLAFARTFVGTGVLAGAAVLMVLLTLRGLRLRVARDKAAR